MSKIVELKTGDKERRISHVDFDSMRQLESVRGMCTGGTAYLLGNGPSLVNAPFDFLLTQSTFGMNMIALIRNYIDVDWWPTYYILVSSAPVNKIWHLPIQQAVCNADLSFVGHRYSHFPLFIGHNFLRVTTTHFDHYESQDALDSWWSDDIAQGVCKFGSSSLAAFQIIAYMGFSRIFLFGFDHGYKYYKANEDPNHFDYGYNPKPHPPELYGEINTAHERAHQIAKVNLDRLGIKVYNATKDSKLEVWPKTRLEDVI